MIINMSNPRLILIENLLSVAVPDSLFSFRKAFHVSPPIAKKIKDTRDAEARRLEKLCASGVRFPAKKNLIGIVRRSLLISVAATDSFPNDSKTIYHCRLQFPVH